MQHIIKSYLLPGFVFQSVIIGGGYGTGVLLVAVGIFAYFGNTPIERVLAFRAVVLYCVHAIFLVWVIVAFGNKIDATLGTGAVAGSWALDGLRHSAYV